jgi:hypothetical protein
MFLPLSAGFVASATFVTATVTAVGVALDTGSIAVPAAVALLLVLALLELTPVRKSLLLRQTPRTLPWVFGSTWGGLAWGLDTGAMVTTLRTSLGSYATLGLCLLGFGSAWSGVAYAVGFCVPLALLLYGYVLPARTTGGTAAVTVALLERIAGHAHRMRLAVAVLMLATAAAVVV